MNSELANRLINEDYSYVAASSLRRSSVSSGKNLIGSTRTKPSPYILIQARTELNDSPRDPREDILRNRRTPSLSISNGVAYALTLSDQSNQPNVNVNPNLPSSSPPSSFYNPYFSIPAHNQFDFACLLQLIFSIFAQ